MAAGIGHRHGDLAAKLLDRALTVGKHVNDLNPPPAGQRLADPSELVEELDLDSMVRHWFGIIRAARVGGCSRELLASDGVGHLEKLTSRFHTDLVPKVPDEYKAQRRQHFIEAAWRCAANRGYRDMSGDDVCSEARLSQRPFYGYFDQKRDLLVSPLRL